MLLYVTGGTSITNTRDLENRLKELTNGRKNITLITGNSSIIEITAKKIAKAKDWKVDKSFEGIEDWGERNNLILDTFSKTGKDLCEVKEKCEILVIVFNKNIRIDYIVIECKRKGIPYIEIRM